MKTKKFLTLLVAAAIVLCMAPAVAMPASAVTSGTTGDCTWTLDEMSGTLTISGNGAMGDYEPWEFPYGGPVWKVIIESGVTSIGNSAFESCVELYGSVVIPDSVTSIGERAFFGLGQGMGNFSSIVIPDSVTSIGYQAFCGCSELTSVTMSNNVTSISDEAFSYCLSLESINIPDGVTSIGSMAFWSCSSLTSISIPDSVTTIGMSAFNDCDGLTSITIPDSVTTIGQLAFAQCDSLTEIKFKGDAPTIGEDIFNCVAITAYYPAGNETWTEDVMQDYDGTTTWVPYEVEEPKAVDEWNLVLDDDLKVCFYLSADIEETATVSVTVGDSTKTSTVSSLEKGEDGRYIVTVQIVAAQMNDNITLQVTDMEPEVFTVRQYCDTVLRDESYSSYHALVKEMLNYGAMAQLYFGHNTQSLANEGITGTAAQQIPEKADGQTVTGKLSGVRFYGASLVYRDKIAVRYYFTGDVSSCTFTANGNTYTPVGNGNICYVEIADILPQNIDQQITLMVTDAAGDILTVAYGPMDYIVRMNAKGNDSLKNLLRALYNYHLAAKALRA